jgi:hypothetical protein
MPSAPRRPAQPLRSAEILRTTQPLACVCGWMAAPCQPGLYSCTVIESRVTFVAPPENADAKLRPPSSTAPGSPQNLSPDLGWTLKLRRWVPVLTM